MKIKRKTIGDLSNEDLLSSYQQERDIECLGELYRRYIPKVYGLCLNYLKNAEMANDAVMDLFTVLVEKVPNYEIANFNSWLYSVAKNHCLQQLRKEKRTDFVNIEQLVMENELIFAHTDKPQTQEETEALNFCLAELVPEQKISINYFFFEDKSYADIVEITGYALSKVKSYIQNGKRNLKNCIAGILNS